MKGVGLLVTGLLLFTSCAVFDELLNPSDITGAVNLIKDTLPPSLTITSPSQGQEVGYIYQITGNVSDSGSGVKNVYVKTDNGTYFPASITSGVWILSISNLSMGTHTNYVYAEDNKGNTCDVQTVVIFRTSVPVLNIVFPNSWYKTEKANLTISGTVSIESPYHITNVKVSLNGGGWSNATGTNSWSLGLTLALGTNTIRVLALADNGKTNLPAVSTVEYKPWTTNKFTAFDGETGDYYGGSVAISSNGFVIVVGAQYEDEKGSETGAVYYSKWNGGGWDTQKIMAADSVNTVYLGCSVAVSADGNTIVAGAAGDDDNGQTSGAFYRFKWNGSFWETNKCKSSDGTNSDIFGYSVAVSTDGNTIVAGACGDDGSKGAVYLFQLNGTNWTQKKFIAYDGANSDYFGWSIALSSDGNTIVVGAKGDDSSKGAVYHFRWNGFTWETNKLIVSGGLNSDNLGYSVAISSDGNTIVAGATGDNSSTGAVYRFQWNGSTWNTEKLIAFDGAVSDLLGSSVAVSADGNTILAGAITDDDMGGGSGSVYRFYQIGNLWMTNKLNAYDGAGNDNFGISVAITPDGSSFISGAYLDDTTIADTGSAYLFTW